MSRGKEFNLAREAAFRATTYRVETPDGTFDLRIDETTPAFSLWLKQHAAYRWSVVTACNPGGELLSSGQNSARHAALGARVVERGWRHVPASNHADAGEWPVEPGYCVLNADEKELLELASEFGQSAIVCGHSENAAAQLVWVGW